MSLTGDILRLSPTELAAKFASWTPRQRVLFKWRISWMSQVRERVNWLKAQGQPAVAKQLPPSGPWFIWFLMTGRGFGKTLSAAQWAGWEAAHDAPGDINAITHVIAPTVDDHRKTTFEGPTGLVNVIPPSLIADLRTSPYYLELDNGSKFLSFTAREPDKLRGPQCGRAWAEEASTWFYDEDTWSNMMLGLRLKIQKQDGGYTSPRVCVTSTPKPRPLINMLTKHKKCVVVRGSLYENKDNLAEEFIDEVSKYEGTRLGRQELHGELLDLEELGIIPRSSMRVWPAAKPLPEFTYIILSLDTAFTEKTRDEETFERDPTGCTVWGVFHEKTVESSYGTTTEKKALASVMLLDAWEDMLGFPELVSRVKVELKKRYGASTPTLVHPQFGPINLRTDGRKPDLVVIEDIGSGKSLRQQLEYDGIFAYAYNPGRADKLARLHVVSPLFVRGRVWVLESPKVAKGEAPPGTLRSWVNPVIEQLCMYAGEGSIKHDEFVDTTSQALRVMMDFGLLRAVDEKWLAEEIRREAEKRARGFVENEDGEPEGFEIDSGPFVNPYAS